MNVFVLSGKWRILFMRICDGRRKRGWFFDIKISFEYRFRQLSLDFFYEA